MAKNDNLDYDFLINSCLQIEGLLFMLRDRDGDCECLDEALQLLRDNVAQFAGAFGVAAPAAAPVVEETAEEAAPAAEEAAEEAAAIAASADFEEAADADMPASDEAPEAPDEAPKAPEATAPAPAPAPEEDEEEILEAVIELDDDDDADGDAAEAPAAVNVSVNAAPAAAEETAVKSTPVVPRVPITPAPQPSLFDDAANQHADDSDDDLDLELEVVEEDYEHLTAGEKQSRAAKETLSRSFSINDKFRFRRELFGNSEVNFSIAIDEIVSMDSFAEVEQYFYGGKHWNPEGDDVKDFMIIVKAYFDSRRR